VEESTERQWKRKCGGHEPCSGTSKGSRESRSDALPGDEEDEQQEDDDDDGDEDGDADDDDDNDEC
jgi:hypothetical protein